MAGEELLGSILCKSLKVIKYSRESKIKNTVIYSALLIDKTSIK